jgi:hypothetical protein
MEYLELLAPEERRDDEEPALLNISQNRSVSSAAPDNIVDPSGLFARCNTLAV